MWACMGYHNKGIFLLQVAHFSKYGLQESDEEEEIHVAKTDLKKVKTGPPAAGLQPAPPLSQQPGPQQAQVSGLLTSLMCSAVIKGLWLLRCLYMEVTCLLIHSFTAEQHKTKRKGFVTIDFYLLK